MIGMLNLGGSPSMSYVNRVMGFGINFTKEHQGGENFSNFYVHPLTRSAGKGYGTEILTWMLDYVFGTLNIHKCCLDVSEDNPRAIHVYEKVGFVREGVLRSSYFKNGKWLDVSISTTLYDTHSLTLDLTEHQNGNPGGRMACAQSRMNFTSPHVTRSIGFFIEQHTTPCQWVLLKELFDVSITQCIVPLPLLRAFIFAFFHTNNLFQLITNVFNSSTGHPTRLTAASAKQQSLPLSPKEQTLALQHHPDQVCKHRHEDVLRSRERRRRLQRCSPATHHSTSLQLRRVAPLPSHIRAPCQRQHAQLRLRVPNHQVDRVRRHTRPKDHTAQAQVSDMGLVLSGHLHLAHHQCFTGWLDYSLHEQAQQPQRQGNYHLVVCSNIG